MTPSFPEMDWDTPRDPAGDSEVHIPKQYDASYDVFEGV